ncbi:MAG: ATP-binding protein [Alteromonadaceae bacterium]|nr:ATP-binding protein [Alteromonadaceae bacterium]
MKIKFIAIQNFRKLKCCQINFSEKETLFVGANNSGKTSAMDALINFLSSNKKKQTDDADIGSTQSNKFHTTDFTLSNWHDINSFGKSWLTNEDQTGNELLEWQTLCPSIDVWLNVEVNEVQKVTHLIPTLKWNGGALGVRLIYQPKDINVLKAEFLADYNAADELIKSEAEQASLLTLWPKSLRDFLDRKLSNHFEVKAYLLDTDKMSCDSAIPQPLMAQQDPLASYPFNGLFKVDVIEAQRGFSDPNSSHGNANKNDGNLSAQLHQYYLKHLNPTDLPDKKDIKALSAIGVAKQSFDERLNESFKNALGEIKGLGYPGFNDPDIQLSSQVNPVDSLDHEASVLFTVQKHGEATDLDFSLPEKYNGLGYKNLIYMVFWLIAFRDNWLRKGKLGKHRTEEDIAIEPLHLVLIEEPEAHLHAQVQQVFIRKAYEVLAKDSRKNLSTQMIVSSHSSYLVHEVDFEKLRYFQRIAAEGNTKVPHAKVIDLSGVFGEEKKRKPKEKQTAEFVARYLKATHCDLFFANGLI